jgi:hypothetical protein
MGLRSAMTSRIDLHPSDHPKCSGRRTFAKPRKFHPPHTDFSLGIVLDRVDGVIDAPFDPMHQLQKWRFAQPAALENGFLPTVTIFLFTLAPY